MANSSMPCSGPLRIDCRGASGTVALRRIESVVKKMRAGPRALVVRVDEGEVIDALIRWSAVGRAPYELFRGTAGTEIRIYLLPRDFDGHPLLAWRPVLGAGPDLALAR